MKVLVTGGAGYIGSVLCEHLLDAGYDVTVLDNLMYGQTGPLHLASDPQFHFVYGNALDHNLMYSEVQDKDVIIPLAAIVGAPACDRNPIQAQRVNFNAISLLCNLTKLPNGPLVVYPNTNSGYGHSEEICTEETPLHPISLYGQLKQYSETTVLCREPSIVLRLATVFGMSPRMRTDLLVNDFVYKAVTDGYLVLFEPHFRRNFVHIRDVADCFIHCIENSGYAQPSGYADSIVATGKRDGTSMVGRAYNVGNDDLNMTKQQLALQIDNHIPIRILYDDLGVDPDKRDYIVSNQRLKDAGFVANRGLDEGIQELIKGYRMFPTGVYKNA